MKLVWHIILKDVRRDRWALLLWAALFVAQVVIGFVLLNDAGEDRAFPMKMQLGSVGLVFAEFIAGYVLVVRLVHADPLFGTQMFWATRPITRGRLLVAKAVAAILIFGILPVALLMPWWIWCGFTLRDLFWTAVETFGWQLVMIAPAFLVATLTNEIARTLMWTVLLLIAVMGWVAMLGSAISPNNAARDELGAAANGLAYTRFWSSVVMAVVFCAAIAAHHYLTNRLVRSVLLTVFGTGLVAIVGLYAPWNWRDTLRSLPQPAMPPEVVAALPSFQFKAGSSMPNDRLGGRAAGRPEGVSLGTEVYVEGLPPEMAISTGTSRLRWTWADGLAIKRYSFYSDGYLSSEALVRRELSLPKPVVDPETLAAMQAERAKQDALLEARRLARGAPASPRVKRLPPDQPGTRIFLYTLVPQALVDRAWKQAPAFDATLDCALSRLVIQTELPLQVGAEGGRNSVRTRIKWIGQGDLGTAASVLISAPAQRQNGLWLVNLIARDRLSSGPGEIMLVNRSNGDCRSAGHTSFMSTRSTYVAGVILSWNSARLGGSKRWNGEKFVDRDPQWAEHSTIVMVGEEIVARFKREVRSERQEFKPSLWVDRVDTDQPVVPTY